MKDDLKSFGSVAISLARSPLGIIALFIVLVYSFACLATAFGSTFSEGQRAQLLYFLMGFPILVLGVFCWLVINHHEKLFGPGDYKNEDNWMEIQRMQMSAAVSLTLASAKNQPPDTTLEVQKLVSVVQHVQPTRAPRATAPAVRRIEALWVDDRPNNNIYERSAFQAVGVVFSLAESTSEALRLISTRKFAAIISDMGRREGPREGYVLLDALRASGNKTPFFIYAGSKSLEHKMETARHGGQGCTNNPQELFQSVTQVILGAN